MDKERGCGFGAGHQGSHMYVALWVYFADNSLTYSASCDVKLHLCGAPCSLHDKQGCQGSCVKVRGICMVQSVQALFIPDCLLYRRQSTQMEITCVMQSYMLAASRVISAKSNAMDQRCVHCLVSLIGQLLCTLNACLKPNFNRSRTKHLKHSCENRYGPAA